VIISLTKPLDDFRPTLHRCSLLVYCSLVLQVP